MNTEIMVVWQKGNMLINKTLGFCGNMDEAIEFAEKHNLGGGVEIANKIKTIPFLSPNGCKIKM